ncbi:hypothetical protein N0V90_003088 [Kalmusia sp. IMI 367209]|nr:hypothetical protein N0V90_003088 [Kalmusia sp. IMI 367209]
MPSSRLQPKNSHSDVAGGGNGDQEERVLDQAPAEGSPNKINSTNDNNEATVLKDNQEQQQDISNVATREPEYNIQQTKSSRRIGLNKTEGSDTLHGQGANRSSLDDLQQWPHSQTWSQFVRRDAEGLQLPLSGAPSQVSDSSIKTMAFGKTLGQSLEQLMLQPEDIPLPEDDTKRKRPDPSSFMKWAAGKKFKSTSKKKPTELQEPAQRRETFETQAYRADITLMGKSFSNLWNTTATNTRHEWSARIVLYDHYANSESRLRRQEPWRNCTEAPSFQEFYQSVRKFDEDCVQRIILVEDLSPSLIDLLGATLHIQPHVFEEHLSDSGYAVKREPSQLKLDENKADKPIRQPRPTFANALNKAHERVISRNPKKGLSKTVQISDWIPPPPESPNVSARHSPPTSTRQANDFPPPPPPPPVVEIQSRTTGAQTQPLETEPPIVALRRRATKVSIASNASQIKISNNIPRTSRRAMMPVLQDKSSQNADHDPVVIYQPIRSRSSSANIFQNASTALQMRAYIESLQNPRSTLEEFEYFLQLPTKGKEEAHDPFRALLRTIHDDTLGLADVIRIALRRIREGTLDEDLMQSRVTFWRSLLYRLNFSLAEFDQRLQEFVHFTYDIGSHTISPESHRELPSEKLAKSTRQTLRACIDLIEKSSDSLRAEMQIVDSRRSISEAESVSKLTELAFVFIPLSFVASLFSMQVHELDGGVPAYKFVVVAIAFVLAAYAVRLSIRSSRILEYKNETLRNIREEADLHYNEPIPTRTFLAWAGTSTSSTLSKFTKSFLVITTPVVLILAVVAAILSPVILLWLRGINRGFKAVITVLLLLLDLLLVYPVVTNASGELDFNPRAMFHEIQRNRETNRKKRERAKRERRKQTGQDPESLFFDGNDSSSHDTPLDSSSDSDSTYSSV